MASSARIDEIKKKFDENPRRYFAPLANEFRKAGDLEQAILICEEFLPQQAGHMSGHIVYGQALYESGRLPESRTVFETALGLDPENLIALRHLGDIARAQGELTDARRWYDRVLEADPRNEEIQALLASMDPAGAAPAPAAEAPALEPWESPAPEAPTVLMEAFDAPAAPGEARQEAPETIAPIDLDLDDAAFDTPAPAPARMPEAPAAPTTSGGFDSIRLDDLEPTNAEADTAAGMPHVSHGRAEGLEHSEFSVPEAAHQRADGLEPSEFEMPTEAPPRAEGLETSEFEVPAGAEASALPDLESSFAAEVGTANAPSSTVDSPLPGLEATGATHPPAVDEPPMPSLDLDEGLAVPAQGALVGDVPLGAAAGTGAENPRLEPPAAMEAMPALELDEFGGAVGATSGAAAPEPAMMELPPEVIAAESALMDAGATAEGADDDAAYVAGGASAPFVTETMAQLYLKQGFHQQALDVYRQLAAASPGDAGLRARVAELESAGRAPAAMEPAAMEPAGPTVREFFFRLATRRPGERAAHDAQPLADDFAGFDTTASTPAPEFLAEPEPAAAAPSAPSAPSGLDFIYEPEPEAAPAAVSAPEPEPVAQAAPAAMPSAAARGATALGAPKSGGTIDALFGTRATSTSEDSAASALAQAFGGSTEAPAITGRPARAATGELSLDSVFRDGPPRPPRASQSFSFDQFFSENAASNTGAPEVPSEGAPANGEPAERTADDVAQFNSWLQGLKPR